MTTIAPPSDADIEASVDRVELDLFARLERQQRHPKRKKRLLFGIGGLTLAAVLVGGGGAVAGVWKLPGSATDHAVGGWATVSGTGPAVITLHDAPTDATWISLRMTCDTVGEVDFSIGTDYGAGVICTAGQTPHSSNGSPTFALGSHDVTLTVTAPAGFEWSTDYRYVDRKFSQWAVNAKGDTYGVVSNDQSPGQQSEPDLQAVGDTDGVIAYVYTKQMFTVPTDLPTDPTQAEHDAYNAKHADDVTSIPAYKSDGVTQIGVFTMGGPDSGLKVNK